ncbi:unnamed protein product [Schistosoma mattheei]|uniref:Uncharacterized protein n=1 Tax=Schistosoma mattheei TaxID=31246 RepID=A0A183P8P6_9TREM|nr:unnamed protein product [Schistosoma mattheei]
MRKMNKNWMEVEKKAQDRLAIRDDEEVDKLLDGFKIAQDGVPSNALQQPTVEENKPDSSGGRNQEEALEMNRTHIEVSTQLCHKASTHHLEFRRSKETRKTKEHITSVNGDRHEKNEQELDGTRK